jgi:predicted metal-dependent hydrolase
MDAQTRAVLEDGQARFNAGQHFEAHDVWEVAWRREAGLDRQLLQGLIMVAAACVKASRSEPRGAVKLLTAALEVLPAEHEHPVVDLERLRSDLTAALALSRAWLEGGPVWVPTLVLVQR